MNISFLLSHFSFGPKAALILSLLTISHSAAAVTGNDTKYPDNMTMVIQLLGLDGVPIDTCEVAAYVGNECRGTARATGGLYYLLIAGEGGGQQVNIVTTFKGRTLILDENITYTSDLNIGTPWEPYVINIGRVMADVNGDGAVDVADIATVIAYMSGTPIPSGRSADVNGDGAVDVADIASIIHVMSSTSLSSRGAGTAD